MAFISFFNILDGIGSFLSYGVESFYDSSVNQSQRFQTRQSIFVGNLAQGKCTPKTNIFARIV